MVPSCLQFSPLGFGMRETSIKFPDTLRLLNIGEGSRVPTLLRLHWYSAGRQNHYRGVRGEPPQSSPADAIFKRFGDPDPGGRKNYTYHFSNMS